MICIEPLLVDMICTAVLLIEVVAVCYQENKLAKKEAPPPGVLRFFDPASDGGDRSSPGSFLSNSMVSIAD
jgi:hypothetical protein